jgi:DNA invertase Pin-like site-specific DNA recombinase
MKIGYARISTADQSLDRQVDVLEEAGCEQIYAEEVSGAAADRPELDACMEQLRDGDTLVVPSLTRLGRSMKDLVGRVETLDEMGVDFQSLQEGIDTDTPQGKLVFHIFGALAEFERELISERTKAGLEAARERGNVGGRPRALDEDDIPQVQALMRDPNVKVTEICDRFDISKKTLYRYVGPDGERRQ